MAGMAHSSFPQIGLQFRFFLHVYWYAARGPGMPGLSRRERKILRSRKKSQAGVFFRPAIGCLACFCGHCAPDWKNLSGTSCHLPLPGEAFARHTF
jgi:hypothetical protein